MIVGINELFNVLKRYQSSLKRSSSVINVNSFELK